LRSGALTSPQFDSVVVDYLHARKFPRLGPAVTWGLRATTAGVLVGVYQFNTNDVGESFFCLSFPRFSLVHISALRPDPPPFLLIRHAITSR
jgi:hypothetical protein